MSYVRALKPEEVPSLVMVCDFDQIHVYSLKKDHPYKPFRVRQLKNHTRIFSLLAGYGALLSGTFLICNSTNGEQPVVQAKH